MDSFNINVLLYMGRVFEKKSPHIAARLGLYKTRASKNI